MSSPNGAVTVRRVVSPLALCAALIVAWQVTVRVSHVPIFIVPAPSDVWHAAVRTAPLLGEHIATTLTEAGLGLALGVTVGALLAVVIAAIPAVGDAIYPLVTFSQTIPIIVLAPLLILWAGFGLTPKVILVALTVFFPVLVSAVSAMRSVEADLTDMVAGLGGGRRHQLWFVRLPAALPGALSGLRLAATYTIGAAVVSEYLAGQSGLGVFIQRSRKAYAVDQIFVAILVIAVLTAVLFVIVDTLCRLATPWQRDQR
ncbi:ABC-type nitrate/sulfonate/bicarbonate transport system, permease component [Sanguibacter gelidistatuariae]|uniref:ABC-type nitrate/sulfonate/bicarbonate transport system, permease component n=1 Tax=Sanguibacter gelidistatuariae TaxID=1814289 RepID=A0A1G6P413_9MICO|nr:ABC transporter permease [Sanguibacter gelidistatuariae]SDC74344.1 ABC-type nitrate/sulfonate/bicarbonate transport system, permease component [Sanguibacter gelidistatuariae]